LAERFVASDSLVPTAGPCPSCGSNTHWSQLIRGSYRRKDAAEGKYDKKRRKKAAAASPSDDEIDEEDDEVEDKPKPRKRSTAKVKPRQRAYSTSSLSSLNSEEDIERSIAFEAAAEGSFDAGCLFVDTFDQDQDDEMQTPEASEEEELPIPTSVESLGVGTRLQI